MPKMKDPYQAGWNAAIEAAAAKLAATSYVVVIANKGIVGEERIRPRFSSEWADVARALAKPIPDDHWRRVNDGDCDYDPPVRRQSHD